MCSNLFESQRQVKDRMGQLLSWPCC